METFIIIYSIITFGLYVVGVAALHLGRKSCK